MGRITPPRYRGTERGGGSHRQRIFPDVVVAFVRLPATTTSGELAASRSARVHAPAAAAEYDGHPTSPAPRGDGQTGEVIDTLVLFGASGDLAGRLLLPALAALRASCGPAADVRLVGSGPEDWTAEEFARHVRARLAEHAGSVDPAARDALIAGSSYRRADVTDPAEVAAVLRDATAPVAVYLALPTHLLLGAVRALATVALPRGSRIAVEKPFGQDAEGAAALNAALAEIDGASAYRVDHALAMTAVEHLTSARLPGGEALPWNSRRIAQVDLLWEETLALEGRAGFYDRAGALRDVVQNHLVQLLVTVAQPASDEAVAGRVAVLRSVRPLRPDEVRARTRRARYTAGQLADGGRTVPDYVDEDGVDPARDTETFAEVILQLDDERWAGTRFVLRAGKALDARRRGVRVHLRDGGDLWLDVDEPSEEQPDGAEPAAYQRIVADLLGGGMAFAVSAVETELAWAIFTPVLQGWADGLVELEGYPAGSPGPDQRRRSAT